MFPIDSILLVTFFCDLSAFKLFNCFIINTINIIYLESCVDMIVYMILVHLFCVTK